jgi:predicted MFS family arabinose efflux permease
VSASLLQQANALLRLALNTTNVAGAALGGIVVALALMRLPAGPRVPGSSIVSELREGWSDFWSRSWLWGIVLQFCLLNAAAQAAVYVLGPAVAKRQLGGAAAWGVMLTATTAGLVLAGLLVLRWQPRRLLLVATVATFGVALLPPALARPLPLAAVIAAAFAAGVCLEIFEVLWQTALQQEIPRDRLSRVTSYDTVGSFAALPIGLAAVGPIAAVAGVRATFLGAAVIAIVSTVLVLTLGEVRRLERAADGG